MWIGRLYERVKRVRKGPRRSQGIRVRRVLCREAAYDSTRVFLEALLSEFRNGETLTRESSRELATQLRGKYSGAGPEADLRWFWKNLFRKTGSPLAAACHAEALLEVGSDREAMAGFVSAFHRDPSLIFEFEDLRGLADSLGRDWLLEYKLVFLHAALNEFDGAGHDVRAMYSELLDEYSTDASAVDRIRFVGKEIDAAVEAGRLPRAIVRRGETRSHHQ